MLNSLACVQFRDAPQNLCELPLFVLHVAVCGFTNSFGHGVFTCMQLPQVSGKNQLWLGDALHMLRRHAGH